MSFPAATIAVRVLLPFKHQDVLFSLARYGRGHGQRFQIRGKLDPLSGIDFAILPLVGQFECVLVQPA